MEYPSWHQSQATTIGRLNRSADGSPRTETVRQRGKKKVLVLEVVVVVVVAAAFWVRVVPFFVGYAEFKFHC